MPTEQDASSGLTTFSLHAFEESASGAIEQRREERTRADRGYVRRWLRLRRLTTCAALAGSEYALLRVEDLPITRGGGAYGHCPPCLLEKISKRLCVDSTEIDAHQGDGLGPRSCQ